MARTEECIYCGRPVDPSKGDGDHVIPARLGKFRNGFRFRRLCVACNGRIGRCEAQLLRCGPERLFRDMVVASTSRSRGRSSSWKVGAGGMPPPTMYLDQPGYGLLLAQKSRSEGDALELVDQLAIEDGSGERHHIRLFPTMTVEALKERVGASQLGEDVTMLLNCSEQEEARYLKLVESAFGGNVTHDSTMLKGRHTARARFKFVYGEPYWRALAKIAFHYYLCQTTRVRGNEEGFAAIRDFITDGGDRGAFFQPGLRFLDDGLPSVAVPTRWVHVLAALEASGVVRAYVCLFWGPKRRRRGHYLVLGRLDSPLIVPHAIWTHVYHYDDQPGPRGKVGEVIAERPFRLR